jgi:hypothetical protein
MAATLLRVNFPLELTNTGVAAPTTSPASALIAPELPIQTAYRETYPAGVGPLSWVDRNTTAVRSD